jgi:hypothetical protein
MDQLAQDDIVAAAAAHRELGRDYDDAVAEGLIERIGTEIDKRVDARFGQRDAGPGGRDRLGRLGDGLAHRDRDGLPGSAGRSSWPLVVLALGSMTVGGITANSLLTGPGAGHAGETFLIALIWIIIGVINVVAFARRR